MNQILLEKDKTKFCDIVGYSPETKILELLLEGREIEYTFNDVVKALGVNRQRAYQILRLYQKVGIIIESKRVKHISMYKLNRQNSEVKLLIKMFDNIIGNN